MNISISDFRFRICGYGFYDVTYYSPVSGKAYSGRTHDMPLIDATKHSDSPRVRDLIRLRRICMGRRSHA